MHDSSAFSMGKSLEALQHTRRDAWLQNIRKLVIHSRKGFEWVFQIWSRGLKSRWFKWSFTLCAQNRHYLGHPTATLCLTTCHSHPISSQLWQSGALPLQSSWTSCTGCVSCPGANLDGLQTKPTPTRLPQWYWHQSDPRMRSWMQIHNIGGLVYLSGDQLGYSM